MKFIDSIEKVASPNQISHNDSSLSSIFGDLRDLEESKAFKELYIRTMLHSPDDSMVEMLGDMGKLSAANWNSVLSTYEETNLSLTTESVDSIISSGWIKPSRITAIVAPVGSGKSTFIHYVFNLVLDSFYRKRTNRRLASLYLDFLLVPTGTMDSKEMVRYLYRELDNHINNEYSCFRRSTEAERRTAFRKEVEIFQSQFLQK